MYALRNGYVIGTSWHILVLARKGLVNEVKFLGL